MSVSQSQTSGAREPISRAAPDAEPSAPECPFCGDEFEVMRRDPGMAWGVCYACAEPICVEVERTS